MVDEKAVKNKKEKERREKENALLDEISHLLGFPDYKFIGKLQLLERVATVLRKKPSKQLGQIDDPEKH